MNQQILEQLANFFCMLIKFRFNLLEKAFDSCKRIEQQIEKDLLPENRRQFYWKLRNNGILGEAIDYVIVTHAHYGETFSENSSDSEEYMVSSIRKKMYLPPYKTKKKNLYVLSRKLSSTLILNAIGKLSVSGIHDEELLVNGEFKSYVVNKRISYRHKNAEKKPSFRQIFDSDINDAIADRFLSRLEANYAYLNGAIGLLTEAIMKNFSLPSTINGKKILSECKNIVNGDIPIGVYYLALTEIINQMPNVSIFDYLNIYIIHMFNLSGSSDSVYDCCYMHPTVVYFNIWYGRQKFKKKIEVFAACTKIGSFMGNSGIKNTILHFLENTEIEIPKICDLFYHVEDYLWKYLHEIILPNGMYIDEETIQNASIYFDEQNNNVDYDEPFDQITEFRALRKKGLERKYKKISRKLYN